MSWGTFLAILIVIIVLADIGSALLHMFLPSVEAEREKQRQRGRAETTQSVPQLVPVNGLEKNESRPPPTPDAR